MREAVRGTATMLYEGPGGVQVSGIGLVGPSLSPPVFNLCCFQVDSEVKMKFTAWRKFVHQVVVLAAAAMAFQPGRYAVEAGVVEPDAARFRWTGLLAEKLRSDREREEKGGRILLSL